MAASAVLLGGAYVAGTVVNHMNNAKKKETLTKLQQQKIDLLEKKNTWLSKKNEAIKRYEEEKKKLVQINKKIALEEKAISQYSFDDIVSSSNSHIKFLITIGNTGDGKSTLCNRLYGDNSSYGDNGPFDVSDQTASATKKVMHKIYNNHHIIVDTPGMNDSEQKDNSHINDLINYLYGAEYINCFCLVRNGTNIRFDNNFQKMLLQYESYFGYKFWNHLIIVLTRIEGKEKIKFIRNKINIKLQNDIHNKFKLNIKIGSHKIPIFTIGSDNDYIKSVKNIRNYLDKSTKFECIKLKSPIDDLINERDEIQEFLDDFGQNLIDNASLNIQKIDKQLENIEKKMKNPSQFPLLWD